LTLLHLNFNQITDITFLSELTSLRSLQLGNNQISDITALEGLTNLTDLFLMYNQITDWSPVSHIPFVPGRLQDK
jgi:Leucine-rich repeat (LRR) protein